MPEKEARPRRRRPEAIPFIIAFIFWALIVIRYFMPGLKITTVSFDVWLNIGYLVILICLVVAAIIRFTLVEGIEAPPAEEACAVEAEVVEERPTKPAGKPAGATPRPKPRAAKAATKSGKVADEVPAGVTVTPATEEEPAEGGSRARPPATAPVTPAPEESIRLIEYPKKLLGDVYSDTFIRLEEGLVLNLRTKLGRVCGNCEELSECQRRVEGKLPAEVFEWNFECKEGLKRELSRAKQAKEPAEALKAAAAAAKLAEATTKAEPATAPPATPTTPATPVTPVTPAPLATPAPTSQPAKPAPDATPAPAATAPQTAEAPKAPEVFTGERMATYGTSEQDEELEVGKDEDEAALVATPVPGHEHTVRLKRKKVLKKKAAPDAADTPVDTLPPEGS